MLARLRHWWERWPPLRLRLSRLHLRHDWETWKDGDLRAEFWPSVHAAGPWCRKCGEVQSGDNRRVQWRVEDDFYDPSPNMILVGVPRMDFRLVASEDWEPPVVIHGSYRRPFKEYVLSPIFLLPR